MAIYTPTNCKSLQDAPLAQIRLGLQGYPGTGKTWGALSFPNPAVLNLDRGLGAHAGRADVLEVPLYDFGFCKSLDKAYHPSKLKEAFITWLDTEGKKLTNEQTLVIDGCTGLQNAYHRWFKTNESLFLTKQGQVDGFAEWTQKRTYYGEVMETLKTLQCNVVFICHEIDQKDKNGPSGPTYSGKVRPLLTGSFGDELGSHFTDWFRAMSADKPKDYATLDAAKIKMEWNMTLAEYKQWCESFPQGTVYYWQTTGDNVFDAKASSMVKFPRYIPADYKSFDKYRRKIS